MVLLAGLPILTEKLPHSRNKSSRVEALPVAEHRGKGGLCVWGVGMSTWAVDHVHLTRTYARNGADLFALAVASLLTGSRGEISHTLALR